MRYFDAYRMTGDNGTKWLFTRCGECGAVVAEVDQETHTEWHGAAARKTEQLRQMYAYAVGELPLATRERLTQPERTCLAQRWNGHPLHEGDHEHHFFKYGPNDMYEGHCGGWPKTTVHDYAPQFGEEDDTPQRKTWPSPSMVDYGLDGREEKREPPMKEMGQ